MDQLCPKCQAPKVNQFQCENCQLIFEKYKTRTNFRDYLKKIKTEDSELVVPYFLDSRNIRSFALPSAFVLALLCLQTNLIYFFSYFSIWIHELGHAMMSWSFGIKATPLSFGTSGMTFSSSEERSYFVLICFIFLNLMTHSKAKRSKAYFLSLLIFPLMIISIFCFFFLSDEKMDEMIVAAGFGGEIIISLLMIISFYFRFPGAGIVYYWLRWPVIFIGFFTLLKTSSNWIDVHKLNSLSPFGVNFSEDAIMGVPGDLHRLMFDHNWSLSKFKRVYTGLCLIAWSLIISIYLFFVSNKVRKNQYLSDLVD